MAKKILLIEDEEFISFIYRRQFEIAGYEVATARDGIAGLDEALKNHYDLVLLDIMMPGMNGIDVLRGIKSEEHSKHTSVIMLTNLAQDDIMNQAFKLGADGYWIKANFSPKDVVNEINKFFEKKEQQSTSTS